MGVAYATPEASHCCGDDPRRAQPPMTPGDGPATIQSRAQLTGSQEPQQQPPPPKRRRQHGARREAAERGAPRSEKPNADAKRESERSPRKDAGDGGHAAVRWTAICGFSFSFLVLPIAQGARSV